LGFQILKQLGHDAVVLHGSIFLSWFKLACGVRKLHHLKKSNLLPKLCIYVEICWAMSSTYWGKFGYSLWQGCGVRVGIVDLEAESEGILGGVGVSKSVQTLTPTFI
jgi:hypothetical protein